MAKTVASKALASLKVRSPSYRQKPNIPLGHVFQKSLYGRKKKADADIANVLTMDEARRIASNIAKLPTFLAANHKI